MQQWRVTGVPGPTCLHRSFSRTRYRHPGTRILPTPPLFRHRSRAPRTRIRSASAVPRVASSPDRAARPPSPESDRPATALMCRPRHPLVPMVIENETQSKLSMAANTLATITSSLLSLISRGLPIASRSRGGPLRTAPSTHQVRKAGCLSSCRILIAAHPELLPASSLSQNFSLFSAKLRTLPVVRQLRSRCSYSRGS